MKFKSLFVIFFVILITLFLGCKSKNKANSDIINSDIVVSKSKSTNEQTSKPVVKKADNTSIYDQFINGEITAKTTEGTYLYVNQFEFLNHGFNYTLFDVDDDNINELCIKNYNLYIFEVKDDELYNIYTDTRADSVILNNGGFFQIKYGDAPKHIYYDYRKINKDGLIEKQVYFSWWDASTIDGVEYPESYYIDDKEVTKEKYDEFAGKYLNIGEDKVFWAKVEPKQEATTSQQTQNEKTDIYTELENTINVPYEKALDNAGSTLEIREVHNFYNQKWQEISDKYYNELIKVEKLKPYIIQLKKDWEVYYNSQIENYRKIYGTIYEGGSLTGIVFDSRERELQKEWAMQLVDIYECN